MVHDAAGAVGRWCFVCVPRDYVNVDDCRGGRVGLVRMARFMFRWGLCVAAVEAQVLGMLLKFLLPLCTCLTAPAPCDAAYARSRITTRVQAWVRRRCAKPSP